MSKIREWLRKWLGVDDWKVWARQFSADIGTQQMREAEQRHADLDLLAKSFDAIALNIEKRLVDLETRNVAPVQTLREPERAGSWSHKINRIERDAALK